MKHRETIPYREGDGDRRPARRPNLQILAGGVDDQPSHSISKNKFCKTFGLTFSAFQHISLFYVFPCYMMFVFPINKPGWSRTITFYGGNTDLALTKIICSILIGNNILSHGSMHVIGGSSTRCNNLECILFWGSSPRTFQENL